MNVIIHTDTHNTTERELMDLCGFLLPWAVEVQEEEDLVKGLANSYGFGDLMPMTGGVVKEDGVYSFPQDPDLMPIATIEREQETMYIYFYGIVSIVYKDERPTFVTRMD